MEKFRIGNDLSIFWAILDDDGQPYPLSDKKVRLFVTHPRGRMEVTDDMSIENGHVVVWNFQASKQRYLGTYKLTVEIYSSPTTRVLRRDIEEAFSLVSSSLYEDIEAGKPDINETGMLRLSSVLEVIRTAPIIPQVGPNRNWWVDGVDTGKSSVGLTAYEFAKEQGYEGTEEEYAAECAAVPALNEASRQAASSAAVAARQASKSATAADEAAVKASTAAEGANVAASVATEAAAGVDKKIEASLAEVDTKLTELSERIDDIGEGAVGPQGPQGEQGEKGADGKSAYDLWIEAGNEGSSEDFLASLKGEQGPQGERGEQGTQGEQGPAGPAGPEGPQGPAGEKGDKGDTGATGPQGPQGEQGERGDKGEQGEKGADGAQGEKGIGISSVIQTTTSSVDDGNNVVTVTLSNGAKSTFTVKNGSKGSQGIQGVQGPKGDTGAIGPEGPKGDKGDTGSQGPQGPEGPKGDQGEQGIQGPKGDKGDTGATGPKGDKGETGPQGNSGYQGAAGELEVVNNLIDGGESAALSAEQGRVLKEEITELSKVLDDVAQKVVQKSVVELEVSWSAGFMGTNGSLYNYTNYQYTNKMPVKEGDVVRLRKKDDTQFPYRVLTAFANDTAVASSGIENGEADYVVPNGVTSIVITALNAVLDISPLYASIVGETVIYENVLLKPVEYVFDKGARWEAYSDSLAANKSIVLADALNLKKGCKYMASFKVGSISDSTTFTMGNVGGYMSSYIIVKKSTLEIYVSGSLSKTLTHGLTIRDFLHIEIESKTDTNNGTANFRLYTNGGEYLKEDNTVYFPQSNGNISFTPSIAVQKVKFVYFSTDLAQDVIIFGDSYISHTDSAKWVYYLMQNGFTKCAMVGYGGAKSHHAMTSFREIAKVRMPKYVIWAMGMNDADTSSAVNAQWLSCVEEVREWCEANDRELILCTIPNVPSIINTHKNAYVKNSGLRYIDFAAAVNAESTGATWYSGMLSSDNVHPTATGGKTLYYRAMIDCPELALLNN